MSFAFLRPKQSVALNASKSRRASEVQLRFEHIDYTAAFGPVFKPTEEVKIMLKILRDLDPFRATLDNSMLYCKYWCCLHRYLQDHNTEKLNVQLLFNLNTHVTDSYTLQLLFFVNRTSKRSVRYILDSVLDVPFDQQQKVYKKWLQPFKIEQLEEAFDLFSELLGILYYVTKVAAPASKWAMEQVTETCQTLCERYETVRGLLFWISGELEMSAAQIRRHQEISDWLGTSLKLFTENQNSQKNFLLKPVLHRIKTLQVINKGQYHSIVLNKHTIASDAYEYATSLGWTPTEQASNCMKINKYSILKKTKSITPGMFEYIGPLPNYHLEKFKKGINPLDFIALEPQC